MAWSKPKPAPPSVRSPRPKTIGEARELVIAKLKQNKWDARDIRFYLNRLGIRPQSIEALSAEDLRTILARMEKTRMIIFEEPAAPPKTAVLAMGKS